MSKHKKRTIRQKMCDPAMCSDCLYICEGDFICERYQELVVSDWEPTENYMKCADGPSNN